MAQGERVVPGGRGKTCEEEQRSDARLPQAVPQAGPQMATGVRAVTGPELLFTDPRVEPREPRDDPALREWGTDALATALECSNHRAERMPGDENPVRRRGQLVRLAHGVQDARRVHQ